MDLYPRYEDWLCARPCPRVGECLVLALSAQRALRHALQYPSYTKPPKGLGCQREHRTDTTKGNLTV